MGTKLKNIASNSITKLIVWLILLITLTMGVFSVVHTFCESKDFGYNIESVYEPIYTESNVFIQEVYSIGYYFRDCLHNEMASKTGYYPDSSEYYSYGAIESVIEPVTQSFTEFGEGKFDYYLSIGEAVYTSNPALDKKYYESQSQYYTYEHLGMSSSLDSTFPIYSEPDIMEQLAMEINKTVCFYFAFQEDYLNEQQMKWEESAIYFTEQQFIKCVFIPCLVAFFSAIYIGFFAGRSPNQKEVKLYTFDKLLVELGLLLLITLVSAIWTIYFGLTALKLNIDPAMYLFEDLVGLTTVSILASIMLIFVFLLSFVRKIKAKVFWKTSLIGRFCVWIWKWIKKGWQKTSLLRELFTRIRKSIKTAWKKIVTNEKLNPFYKKAVVEQQKSENTKTELIANISHDLKTPLTSIISYVDLLQKEEDLSDTARDYVNIIAQKSDRLNHMVSDLFDLSKSVSGNLAIEIEILDFKKLVEQTLAEMKDSIDESDVLVKATFPEKAVMVRTDGNKMYRVLQNLIDNSLKYSLKGSRVFVSIDVVDGKAIATVKNTAKYEIDFTEEEIMQRFTRGDKARSSEGSGLGLSIAESFTQSCGGEFKLEFDGDLFKVIMAFDCIE